MKTRIAINGFGRIGRLTLRQLTDCSSIEIVAINDLSSSPELAAYLLRFDTTQGIFRHSDSVSSDNNSITVNGTQIPFFNISDASLLPWGELGVDYVIDCSGAYLSKEKAELHLKAGAKKVILSAPAGDEVPAVVYGINHETLSESDNIISAASCSTNALAPIVLHLHRYAQIKSGMMLVIHGYTATQMLQDNAQKKGNFRRSRAAAENIIPTTAGAAKAVGKVIPELNGLLDGSAVRVPVPVGCLITFTAVVEKSGGLSAEGINEMMAEKESEIYGYARDLYVSSDITGITQASVFDPTQTLVSTIGNDQYEVRVAAWFDNETSFVSQMTRLLLHLCKSH